MWVSFPLKFGLPSPHSPGVHSEFLTHQTVPASDCTSFPSSRPPRECGGHSGSLFYETVETRDYTVVSGRGDPWLTRVQTTGRPASLFGKKTISFVRDVPVRDKNIFILSCAFLSNNYNSIRNKSLLRTCKPLNLNSYWTIDIRRLIGKRGNI